MIREATVIVSSCISCPFGGYARTSDYTGYHYCDKLDLKTEEYSPYDTIMDNIMTVTVTRWFENLCPLRRTS